jgi:hypothetical protein
VILEGGGDGQEAEAMKVIKIKDSTEGCHVGFLQWHIIKGARQEELMDYFGQEIMLYKDSTIEVMKWKNMHLIGMAGVVPSPVQHTDYRMRGLDN